MEARGSGRQCPHCKVNHAADHAANPSYLVSFSCAPAATALCFPPLALQPFYSAFRAFLGAWLSGCCPSLTLPRNMERLNPLAERDGSFDRRASSLLSNPGPSRSSRSWLTRMTFAVLLLAAAFPFGAHGSCDFQFPPDEPQSTLPSHYSRFKVFDCRHTST